MTNLINTLPDVLKLFEILLVVTALWITTSETVKQAILAYRWQSALLAIVTTVTAFYKYNKDSLSGEQTATVNVSLLILFIALLPLLLLVTIRPLLLRATLESRGAFDRADKLSSSNGEALGLGDDLKMLVAALTGPLLQPLYRLWAHIIPQAPSRQIPLTLPQRVVSRQERYQALERDAETVWQSRQVVQKGSVNLLFFPILLLIAFLVPFRIPSLELPDRIGLAVSLALHLLGLYNMIVKRDIISQVIGLLIMDHGLFLAVVRIVGIPVPASLFVAGLYLYTLITIFILVVLLPTVRTKLDSIDLADIASRSELTSRITE